MNSIDVLLISPPFWLNLDMPNMALPVLGAELAKHNLKINLLDLNAVLINKLKEKYRECDLQQLLKKFQQIIQIEKDLNLSLSDLTMLISNINYESTVKKLIQKIESEEYLFFKTFYCVLKENITYSSIEVVGISILTETQLFFSLVIGKFIREIYGQDVKIVVGGPWCSLLKEKFNNKHIIFNYFDDMIVGAGEGKLLEYCFSAIRKSSNTLNLAVSSNSEMIFRKNRIIPTYHLLDLSLYNNGQLHKLPVQLSRGCYHNSCKFCNYIDLNKTYCVRDVDNVVNELKILQDKFNIQHFVFVDDAIHPQILIKLSEKIIQNNLSISWSAITRPDSAFDKSCMKKIVLAGCTNVFIGFESGCDKTLQQINKKTTVAKIRKIINEVSHYPLKITANFIIGFPGECINSILSTMFLAEELKSYNCNVSVQEFLLNRGSYFWHKRNEYINDCSYLNLLEQNDTVINFKFPRDKYIQDEIDKLINCF